MHLPTNFSVSLRSQSISFILIISGLICVIFAFARGLDKPSDRILYVMDNSLSMAVTDISGGSGVLISRLDFAKQMIASLSRVLWGEQAVMTAALWARLEVPMTDSSTSISDVIWGINVESHAGGSSISTPLEMIRLIYGNTPHLSIVWFTDGEFSDSVATLSGWTSSPTIVFIWVGTRAGWPILLGYDSDGRPRYKESDGKKVNSVRDADRLLVISESIGADLILSEWARDDIIESIAKNKNSNTIPPYLTLWWVLLIVAGSVWSRFQYNTIPHWK